MGYVFIYQGNKDKAIFTRQNVHNLQSRIGRCCQLMKGLQLAEEYYKTWGEPMIREKFGDTADRIAVGLVGPGSECFGFDDEISRDHDWGPGFCMWLAADDFKRIGEGLQAAYQKLPKTFLEFGPRQASPGEENRTGVAKIVNFYRTYIGLDHVPATNREWIYLTEQSLATCTNGRVFHDPSGQFTRWRNHLLGFYPEDVRLKKIASRCVTACQSGQYNFIRSLKRNELFAAQFALSQFGADAMSLIFLLNKRYAPFYKWMHQAVKELTLLGEIVYKLICDLLEKNDIETKTFIIEDICARIIKEFHQQGLSDSNSDFLFDHAKSIHTRISDNTLGENISLLV